MSTNHESSMTSASAPSHGISVQDASAWILRVGVIASVVVMMAGLTVSFLRHHASIEHMQHAAFDASLAHLWQGLGELRGQSIIELGIYMLVLTPILRVVASMVLFLVEEHDWLYTAVTFFVLVLTLAGLLFLK